MAVVEVVSPLIFSQLDFSLSLAVFSDLPRRFSERLLLPPPLPLAASQAEPPSSPRELSKVAPPSPTPAPALNQTPLLHSALIKGAQVRDTQPHTIAIFNRKKGRGETLFFCHFFFLFLCEVGGWWGLSQLNLSDTAAGPGRECIDQT